MSTFNSGSYLTTFFLPNGSNSPDNLLYLSDIRTCWSLTSPTPRPLSLPKKYGILCWTRRLFRRFQMRTGTATQGEPGFLERSPEGIRWPCSWSRCSRGPTTELINSSSSSSSNARTSESKEEHAATVNSLSLP